MGTYEWQVPSEADGVAFPGTGVAVGCEPPELSAENQTLVLVLNQALRTRHPCHLLSFCQV